MNLISYGLIFVSHIFTGSPSGFNRDNLGLQTVRTVYAALDYSKNAGLGGNGKYTIGRGS